MNADTIYHDMLLDLAREPLHQGTHEHPDILAQGLNASCGDEVTLFVELSSDKKTIKKLVWQGKGCVISQAAMSVVADLVQGQPVEKISLLTYEQLVAALGFEQLSPGRVKCILLGLSTIKEKILPEMEQT